MEKEGQQQHIQSPPPCYNKSEEGQQQHIQVTTAMLQQEQPPLGVLTSAASCVGYCGLDIPFPIVVLFMQPCSGEM